MPYEHYGELASFGLSLDLAIADGMFDGSLTVRDGHGAHPVVAALAEERLHYLYERLDACGGRANVFVRDHARVRVIHAVGAGEAPQAGPGNGPATVGSLVARLETRPEGIRISDGTALLLGGQTVAWDRMPDVGRIDVPSCSRSSSA